MNLMKFLYGLCIFYMVNLLSCPLVLAQPEACTFSDSEIEGVEVGQIGDRKIYTLFTAHVSGETNEVMRLVNILTPIEAVAPLIGLIQKISRKNHI